MWGPKRATYPPNRRLAEAWGHVDWPIQEIQLDTTHELSRVGSLRKLEEPQTLFSCDAFEVLYLVRKGNFGVEIDHCII